MSKFLKAICQNLQKFTTNSGSYQFPELEFTIEKGKNFQIIDEKNFHFDAEFFEGEENPAPVKKDLVGKVIRTSEVEWAIDVKFLTQTHANQFNFQCGIYINESASGFTKQVTMNIQLNSQQFSSYSEELFIIGNQLKSKKIREHWQESHKSREVKLDLTSFTQNILSLDTKSLWQEIGPDVESYYAKKQPVERKYPKRVVLKEKVINEKKISLNEIAQIVSDIKVQEEKNRKQQELARQQRIKEREEKRKKEEQELAQKGSQIQELAKFYKEQKISDKLYSLTTSALSSLPVQTAQPAAPKQQQLIQYHYQNPLSLEYIYGGRGSEFMLQEFENSLSWGNESFGYKGIIQKQLKEMKEKEKKKKIKGIRPIAQEQKERHSVRPIKKIKIQ